MIPQFSFGEFLRRIEGKGYREIILQAQDEIAAIEPGLSGVRGAPSRRRQGGPQYVAMLKKFLFFLRTGTRPGGLDDEAFAKFRPVCQSLVDRGELNAAALTVFSKPKAES